MKTIITSGIIILISLSALIGFNVANYINQPEIDQPETELGSYSFIKAVTPLDAVSASSTSEAIEIEGAKRVTLYFDHSVLTDGHGTTTFDVDVSVDGTNFVNYNKLVDDVTNTIAQGLTRVASEVLDSTTGTILTMDLDKDIFKSFKVNSIISSNSTTTESTVYSLIAY